MEKISTEIVVKNSEAKESIIRLERRPEVGYLCFVCNLRDNFVNRVSNWYEQETQSTLGHDFYTTEEAAIAGAKAFIGNQYGEYKITVIRIEV